jgi:hypothetical protein
VQVAKYLGPADWEDQFCRFIFWVYFLERFF